MSKNVLIFHTFSPVNFLQIKWHRSPLPAAHNTSSDSARISHMLSISAFLLCAFACVCLCVCVRVYASVCQTLTAIASDTKWLFSEGFAPFHVLIASLWWQGGPLLRAALSHDSCNIYMFTLTISICCFWNNQQQRPGENGCKSRSTWVSWLGGWAWLCSAWVEGSSRRGGGGFGFLFFKAFPRFLMAGWK